MRYYWGLAVGHVYTHDNTTGIRDSTAAQTSNPTIDDQPELESNFTPEVGIVYLQDHDAGHDSEGDNLEFSFENREDDNLSGGEAGEDYEDEMGPECNYPRLAISVNDISSTYAFDD